MRKMLDLEEFEDRRPVPKIFSAFMRDTLSGLLYVEAHSRGAVEEALENLLGVYLKKGIQLVPVDEMPALLKLTKKRVELKPQSWVRIKRGRYRGDLAKVIEVSDNGESVTCKFIPRIDLSPAEDDLAGKKKRKAAALSSKAGFRPPAKYFSADKIIEAYGRRAVQYKRDYAIFQDDVYAEGFLEKDLKLSSLETDGVFPTMDELEAFAGPASAERRKEGEEPGADYSALQEQVRLASVSALQPGDIAEVMQDQNKGAVGTVVTISEGIVTIRRTSGENAGAELTVRGEFVKKLFRQGEHVKVISGKNLDETGLVLKVEGDSVTLMSDLSKQEINAFAKDLRVASEVGSGLNAVGQHELHDLVSYRSVPARCRRLTLPSGVWTLTSVLSHGAATSTVSSTGPSATSSTCSRFRARSSRPSRASSRAPTRSAGRRPTTSTASRSTRARRSSRLRAR
jgi:transcription elongation factor SPT5